MAAKCAVYAGAYKGVDAKYLTVPGPEVFADLDSRIPNYSAWIITVSVAVIRPQIPTLDERPEKYNRRYDFFIEKLVEQRGSFLSTPIHAQNMTPTHNSIQFNLLHDLKNKQVIKFLEEAAAHGLFLSSSSATCPTAEI